MPKSPLGIVATKTQNYPVAAEVSNTVAAKEERLNFVTSIISLSEFGCITLAASFSRRYHIRTKFGIRRDMWDKLVPY